MPAADDAALAKAQAKKDKRERQKAKRGLTTWATDELCRQSPAVASSGEHTDGPAEPEPAGRVTAPSAVDEGRDDDASNSRACVSVVAAPEASRAAEERVLLHPRTMAELQLAMHGLLAVHTAHATPPHCASSKTSRKKSQRHQNRAAASDKLVRGAAHPRRILSTHASVLLLLLRWTLAAAGNA